MLQTTLFPQNYGKRGKLMKPQETIFIQGEENLMHSKDRWNIIIVDVYSSFYIKWII
jgi:hypothetical protein